jgi:hypothetical protein
MKLKFALIVAALAFTFQAFAADQPKLTLQQCKDILDALTALSLGQYPAVDKDYKPIVDKEGKTILLPYRLGNQRGAIAMNIEVLTTIVKAGDQERVAIVKKVLPNGTPPQGEPNTPERRAYEHFIQTDPAYQEFTRQYQELLDSKQNIVLVRLKFGPNKGEIDDGDPPEHVPISPVIEAPLQPIIDR